MSLDDLLQALLGGADSGQQRSAGSASSGDPLSDMLQGMLGGGSSQQSGGLGDILSSILGGGQATEPQDSSIVEGVSGQTGLSQVVVQMVLSFVMSKLLSGMAGGSSGGLGGLFPGAQRETEPAQGQSAGQGLDLDSLLEQMGQDQGMADELAQQTGLDSTTAQKSLQEVLGALGAQRRSRGSAAGGSQQSDKQGGLDDLLQSW